MQLETLQEYIKQFHNLQTVGRNRMHRYNNQDHSMLTALLAARNIAGRSHDIWNVNVERSYHESFTNKEWTTRQKPENIATDALTLPSSGRSAEAPQVDNEEKGFRG